MRVVFVERPHYVITTEEINGCQFVHVVMETASKKILRDIKEDWADLVLRLYLMGYEELFTYTKDMRIVNYIGGGEVIGEYEDWTVVKWELN